MKLRSFILTTTVMVMIASFVSSLAGCNTWKGAGKDVERAGEKMQGEE